MGTGQSQTERPGASRVLLILEECGVGDGLRISFGVNAVRTSYPSAEIVLLVDQDAFEVFEHSPVLDRVVASKLYSTATRSRLGQRLWKFKELLSVVSHVGFGYDLVIIFGWGTTLLNLVAWLVGRRHRIGYARGRLDTLTSKLGPFVPDNYVEQNLKLLRAAGIDVERAAPSMPLMPQDLAMADRLLQQHGLAHSASLVVLHPGSDWACQQWLPERWSELADRLADRLHMDIAFTGLASEQGYIDAIRRHMQAPATSLAGKTTLRQLAALVSRARLCVCVDSVVFELCQATAVPAVVVAGPSASEEVGPGPRPPLIINRTSLELRATISSCQDGKAPMIYREDTLWSCLNFECPMAGLRNVSVAEVLQAVESLLV